MKKELKRHPISNITTFIGIVIVLFLISFCMLFGERYQSAKQKQNEEYGMTCMIEETESDITAEQTERVVAGYKAIADSYSVNARLEDLGEQKILTSHALKQEGDHMSSEDIETICGLINEGALCFVLHSSQPLNDAFRELAALCEDNGFVIGVNESKEVSERETLIMEKRLYLMLRYGSIAFSSLFLFLSLFLWFDKRKHEWFIRNICGQSVQELIVEAMKILLSFMVLAYVITVAGLSIYKPASIGNILRYGLIGFSESVFCMIVLCVRYSRIKR